MKKISAYILIALIFTSISAPIYTYAQEETPTSPNYILLTPLSCEDGTENCDQGQLTSIDPNQGLGSYLNIMIRIFIGICAVLAMVMIVIGGMEYMTSELISSKESGKQKITGAVFGLIIALGSYALLNTINPDLLKTDIEIKGVKLEVILDDSVPQTPINGVYKNGIAMNSPWDNDSAGAIRTSLPPNVTLNNKECSYVGETGCTSTRGLPNLNAIIAIQRGCSCNLIITGGTEFWLHGGTSGNTSHKPGSATVDLRSTTELDKYLSGGEPLKYFTIYQSPVGSVLYEKDHWHIGS